MNNKLSAINRNKKLNLTIISPSNWLLEQSQSSRLFKKFNQYLIPHGVDENIYLPRDRKFSRELFNIPQEKIMLLFVADDINNKRKGFNILLKAFNNIRQKDNIIICTVGSNANVSRDDNIYNLGKIYDERLLSMAYSAADILINPAIEEAFGNTIIESSMCGTPVVGFAVGGLNDTIIQNHNGRLCKEISVDALKEEI